MKSQGRALQRVDGATVRRVRGELHACRPQAEVAAMLGLSRREIDRAELSALAKVCWGLRRETAEARA